MADHEIRMSYTESGQDQPSNWDARSLGAVGQYALPIEWDRLGHFWGAITITFESSSPMRRDMLALSAAIEGTQ